MTLEGLAAVQARIAHLTGRTTTTEPSSTTATTAAGSAGGEFQSLLDVALGATGTTTLTATGSPAVGPVTEPLSTGKLTPPPELAGYGNGRIPAGALAPIGVGNHRLYGPAAQSFQRLMADAASDGVTIGVTDSYRGYDAQVDLARRKGLYSNGGLAATPGTSNHGWGLSLDLDLDTTAQAWMRQNGARYGFVEDVPREPWHWTYRAL